MSPVLFERFASASIFIGRVRSEKQRNGSIVFHWTRMRGFFTQLFVDECFISHEMRKNLTWQRAHADCTRHDVTNVTSQSFQYDGRKHFFMVVYQDCDDVTRQQLDVHDTWFDSGRLLPDDATTVSDITTEEPEDEVGFIKAASITTKQSREARRASA